MKKSVPFFPQADQVFFDLSSIQVAWRTAAAAAQIAALLLIVALQSSSGAAAATEHTQVDMLQHHLLFYDFGNCYLGSVSDWFLVFRGLCYTVLLIPFVSERGLSVAALKSALTVLKAVLSSSSSRAAAYICGHVLGLWIQGRTHC